MRSRRIRGLLGSGCHNLDHRAGQGSPRRVGAQGRGQGRRGRGAKEFSCPAIRSERLIPAGGQTEPALSLPNCPPAHRSLPSPEPLPLSSTSQVSGCCTCLAQVWLVSGRSQVFYNAPDLMALPVGDLGKARAHWLSRDVLAWRADTDGSRFMLHCCPSASLKNSKGQLRGGESPWACAFPPLSPSLSRAVVAFSQSWAAPGFYCRQAPPSGTLERNAFHWLAQSAESRTPALRPPVPPG